MRQVITELCGSPACAACAFELFGLSLYFLRARWCDPPRQSIRRRQFLRHLEYPEFRQGRFSLLIMKIVAAFRATKPILGAINPKSTPTLTAFGILGRLGSLTHVANPRFGGVRSVDRSMYLEALKMSQDPDGASARGRFRSPKNFGQHRRGHR
jgi:hypothetical protein